jgi:hypothetical protein
MFKNLIKGLLAGIGLKLLDDYRRVSLQLLKIEAAKCYMHGVRTARLSAIGLMRMGLVIGLMCVGVLLLHAGLFILLPGTVAVKAAVGLFLGLVYVTIGAVVLRGAMSERAWMQQSGAADILAEATGRPRRD